MGNKMPMIAMAARAIVHQHYISAGVSAENSAHYADDEWPEWVPEARAAVLAIRDVTEVIATEALPESLAMDGWTTDIIAGNHHRVISLILEEPDQ